MSLVITNTQFDEVAERAAEEATRLDTLDPYPPAWQDDFLHWEDLKNSCPCCGALPGTLHDSGCFLAGYVAGYEDDDDDYEDPPLDDDRGVPIPPRQLKGGWVAQAENEQFWEKHRVTQEQTPRARLGDEGEDISMEDVLGGGPRNQEPTQF
jgi:hypothetical protein